MADMEGTLRAAPARNRWSWLCLVLLVLVVASSFGVIYTAHSSRGAASSSRRGVTRTRSRTSGGNCCSSAAPCSSHARVEVIARDRLRMVPVEGEFRVLVGE